MLVEYVLGYSLSTFGIQVLAIVGKCVLISEFGLSLLGDCIPLAKTLIMLNKMLENSSSSIYTSNMSNSTRGW
jgi:hypothetical protein